MSNVETKYRLKKDTWWGKAGTECHRNLKGNMVCGSRVILTKNDIKARPGVLGEWFEKVPETIRICVPLEREQPRAFPVGESRLLIPTVEHPSTVERADAITAYLEAVQAEGYSINLDAVTRIMMDQPTRFPVGTIEYVDGCLVWELGDDHDGTSLWAFVTKGVK